MQHRRHLLVTATSFGVNGALYGTLLSRFPEIADHVQATESGFGFALFAAALGGLAGSILAPRLVARVAELGATTLLSCAYALLAVAVAFSPALGVLAAAFLALGLFDGGHDVAMNALAVRAQQRLGTPVMGRVHGVWSLALTMAGALGAVAAGAGLPVGVHVAIVAAITFALQLAVFAWGRAADSDAAPAPPAERSPPPAAPRHLPWRTVIGVLGIAALAASFVESPGQEWTGLLLRREFGASTALAAAAPVVFSAGLVVSRLLLDAGTRRLGAPVMATSAGVGIVLSMAAGGAVALTGGSAALVLGCVALLGLAAGPVFPLLFGAADHISARFGIAPARATSIASMLSRLGAISAPVAVGALAESLGLSVVFAVVAVGGAVLLLTLPRVVR